MDAGRPCSAFGRFDDDDSLPVVKGKKPKTKKKLSEKEEEKLYKEKMRHQELEELAQAVQKEIEAMLAAAAAPAK